MTETVGRKGKIVQVLGAVIDVEFPQGGGIPKIYDAVVTTNPTIDDQENNLVLEVAQHLGDNVVRCIAMDSSEGWFVVRKLSILALLSRCQLVKRPSVEF